MKKLIALMAVMAAFTISIYADFSQNGWYRVQNFSTTRWISVIDNKGKIDYGATSADLGAIYLEKRMDVVVSDPATVLYVSQMGGSNFQVETQGTGIHQIIGHYVQFGDAGSGDSGKLYYCTGTYNGMTKYISDTKWQTTSNSGTAATTGKGDNRKWYIHPISENSDNFFGLLPTVKAQDKNYTTLYASFPFSMLENGVKAYVVCGIADGKVQLAEVSGTVAAGTPLVMLCGGEDPADNKLHVGGTGSKPESNLLKGVYFSSTTNNAHLNYTEYDPETMRVLGTCSDGTIGFVKAKDLKYLTANSAYLTVSAGSPEELKCEVVNTAAVGEVDEEETEGKRSVFTLQGVRLYEDATDAQIDALPKGFYIIGGKKILK